MRICIVGCGAIGGLFAAHLARLPDVEVWAYDRDHAHVDAINRDGLRLIGRTEVVASVNARTDPDEIPACRFGIVATKGTVTGPAIAVVAPAFAEGAVCSVQNGIGNEELIAAHVTRVMRGVTLPASRVAAPGVIESDGHGLTWVGPFEPSPASLEEVGQLAGLFTDSGLETRPVADARPAQWTKLLFNCATNPLCALTGLTHGQLIDHAPTRRLARAVIEEGRAVAGALGIELEEDPLELVERLGGENYGHRPSMLQDVSAQRRTEIALLNGGVAKAGRECGVPTPLNEAICELVTGVEQSWLL
ncbi:MAG TPA: 2-dehydropantoate 2-reductase [Solirubrobacteraceae bacterium]